VLITDLGKYPQWILTLARWHFEQWGPLTGADTLDTYVALLTSASQSRTVPSVLIAIAEEGLLGSATLVVCDLPVREALTPWLARLFVEPTQRRHGVGAALVHAVLRRAQDCGYRRLYLYTSGTLPEYYARLGWRTVERLQYLGRERTVMDYDLGELPTGEAVALHRTDPDGVRS
jgi:GNAT superfamily N-acetyltransferase